MKLKVKIHPSSTQEKIVKISDDELEVWIREKPIDGKANSYLEKFLRKYLGKKCKVVAGFTSRIKLIELLD